MKTYVIFKLVLSAVTGESFGVERYLDVSFSTYEDCGHYITGLPAEHAVDGRVIVYDCAVEKEVTTL